MTRAALTVSSVSIPKAALHKQKTSERHCDTKEFHMVHEKIVSFVKIK